jgi:hypothetical protein
VLKNSITVATLVAMLTVLTSSAIASPKLNNSPRITASQQSSLINSSLKFGAIAQLPNRQPTQSIPLASASLEVGGISVLFTEAQLKQRLGQPKEVTNENNMFGVRRYLYYGKNGIHGIYVIKERNSKQFRFCSMLVNGAPSATHDGIRVGDPSQKVIATYGNPASVWQQGDGEILYYRTVANSAELAFTVTDGKVTQIQLSRSVNHDGQTAC